MCRPTVFFFFVFVFETELNFTGPVCMCRVCYSILQGFFSKSRYRTNITYIPIVHRKTIYLDLLKWSKYNSVNANCDCRLRYELSDGGACPPGYAFWRHSRFRRRQRSIRFDWSAFDYALARPVIYEGNWPFLVFRSWKELVIKPAAHVFQ